MTVTLTFNPDVEAELLARAHASGMAVEDYLKALVEQETISSSGKISDGESARRSEAVRRMIEFGEKYHLDPGEPITRELLHEGHRY